MSAEKSRIIPMTHASETGADFWYACRANRGPDSSGTRFRHRLEHYCSKLESGVHATKKHCTKVHN